MLPIKSKQKSLFYGVCKNTGIKPTSTQAFRLSPWTFSSAKVREIDRTSKFCTGSVKLMYLVVFYPKKCQFGGSEGKQTISERFSWVKISPLTSDMREWKPSYRT